MTETQDIGRERQTILLDLWDVPGLGEHITNVHINSLGRCQVYLDRDARVAPLAIAHGLLAEPHAFARGEDVFLLGSYRDVRVIFVVTMAPDESAAVRAASAAQSALADLLSAVERGGAR